MCNQLSKKKKKTFFILRLPKKNKESANPKMYKKTDVSPNEIKPVKGSDV